MKNISISDLCQGKSNNLSLIKFAAAVLVILSHAGPLACGSTDILMRLTHGSISLGVIAVSIFFMTGGFYNTKSILQKKTAVKYFKARITKIFPPLIVVVVISVIGGSVLTTYDMKTYWSSMETWKYLTNGLLILQHNLPGVFVNNPYNSTVNGSLWTLPVEFLCYVVCYMFYRMGLMSNKFLNSIPFVLVAVIGYKTFVSIPIIDSMMKPCLMFYIGMGLYNYRHKIRINIVGNFIALCTFLALVILGWGSFAVIFAFPYIILYIIFGMPQCGERLARLGNISYGMYLCAFPIQQCIALISDSAYVNFAVALPLSMLGGWLLHKYVEHPIVEHSKKKTNLLEEVISGKSTSI